MCDSSLWLVWHSYWQRWQSLWWSGLVYSTAWQTVSCALSGGNGPDEHGKWKDSRVIATQRPKRSDTR